MADIAKESSVIDRARPGLFRRWLAWLLSSRHFHYKLLSGTTAAVVVIIFLAGAFLFISLRNQFQDTMRAHTVQVMRLSSVIENDIAALESSDRAFLLTREPRYQELFQQHRQTFKKRID